MMNVIIKTISQVLTPICKKLPIEVVYLYGSVARGQNDSLSDYDFGILFSHHITAKKRFDWRLKLFSIFAKNLNLFEDRIDVVDLQEVSVLLQFNAISGKTMYAKTQKERVGFESYVMARYNDEHYYLDRYLLETVKKLVKGDYFEQRIPYSRTKIGSA